MDTIIDRLRYIIKLSRLTQGRFAERIGIDPSNLSKHLTGKSPVSESLVNRIVIETGVSKRWLRDGYGLPFGKDTLPDTLNLDSPLENNISWRNEGTPVYDIDVTAGCCELASLFSRSNAIGTVDLPGLRNDENVIVHVSGDSMLPVIKNGGYIAIRPINNLQHIFWGQIYVIIMDDYRMVKYLRRHPSDRSKVILRSANPDYDDMEVDRADIRSLFFVDAILNYEVRG